MSRDNTRRVLGFAVTVSVAIHVGAIGLLESFVSTSHRALAAFEDPPVMLSVTLVEATRSGPAPEVRALAAIRPQRDTRRKELDVGVPSGGASAILQSASEAALPPRETASPQPPISEPVATLPTPDSLSSDALAVQGTRSTVAKTAGVSGGQNGPASAGVAYLNSPSPSYPESARRDGQEGLTVVEVLVSKNGTPLDVKIATTSGFEALDGAAVAGVKRWLFTPATRDHEAIDARIRIPIRFRLNEDRR